MVDYSKWKDIEVSDDEDDTHPNIDTPSLFKWRHEARLQRMQEHDEEKKKLTASKNNYVARLEATRERAKQAQEKGLSGYTALKKRLEEVEAEGADIEKQWSEFQKKEKMLPWNVDTISTPGFSKTVINTIAKPKTDSLTEEEREGRLRTFIKNYEKEIKEYGLLKKFDDSRRYLTDHMHLVCEDTANYLVIWAINLEMEEKHDLMEHVAHQCICMNYLLELAKQLDIAPQGCVGSFFTRIHVADADYKRAFTDEIEAFKSRIRKRAKEKLEDAIREHEEEEREKRLGPGDLDPVEVFESLPVALQKCFESRDTDLLKATIASMDEQDARYHMKRCVDSGLWVADAGSLEEELATGEAPQANSGAQKKELAAGKAASGAQKELATVEVPPSASEGQREKLATPAPSEEQKDEHIYETLPQKDLDD